MSFFRRLPHRYYSQTRHQPQALDQPTRCLSFAPFRGLQRAIGPWEEAKTARHSHRAFTSTSTAFQRNASRRFSSSSIQNDGLQSAAPGGGEIQLDFFGEPVTFLGVGGSDRTSQPMAAVDGFLLAAVSRGKSCMGGSDAEGLEVQSNHAVALSWAEGLRHAAVWNQSAQKDDEDDNDAGDPEASSSTTTRPAKSAPMLAAVVVSPVLAQAGAAYVRHLDTLLKQAKPGTPGLPPIEMAKMAEWAASRREDNHLTQRERLHLKALHYLLRDQHTTALSVVLKILRSAPGDVLALSLAMDLAHTLGDKRSAMQAAGSVVAYWNERRGGFVRPAIPGQAMVSALVALGFAVGGRPDEAEIIAKGAMQRGRREGGALATWAQAHIFDAGGRVSEGISALSNFDGVANYEGAGFLFFESRLGGYGARFSLDREERGRGKSAALRLYEAHFERVIDYSGFSSRQPWQKPQQRAPISWLERKLVGTGTEASSTGGSSIFGSWFGDQSKDEKEEKLDEDYEIAVKQDYSPSRKVERWDPSCEDVLTWIPPTPQLLSDATLLLLRFTLNGTISARNARWDSLRNAWEVMLDIQRKQSGSSASLCFCPLASIAASILVPPSETGSDTIPSGAMAAKGLHKMGHLLNLGRVSTDEEATTAVRELIAERQPDFWLPVESDEAEQWREVVRDLAMAIDGIEYEEEGDELVEISLRYEAWEFDSRPIFEHAIIYACCKVGDIESLSLARSICSKGVNLRANSPEEWWRYSIVLGLLGDQVASEDALNTSINVGGGQGARGG